jgi:hypothetical protein
LQEDRRDALVFSALTVLLTPFFLFLALLGIAFAMYYADLPIFDHIGYYSSVTTGANIFVAWMFVVYLTQNATWHHKPADKRWLWAAAGFYGVLLLASYGTNISASAPAAFAVLYVVGVLAIFGSLGRLYMPHDDYYLGLYRGYFDDPFTFDDDFDRGHLSLGVASAIPQSIIKAYGEIFASSWLWRPLSERELIAASEMLYGLSIGDHQRVERMAVRDRALYALNRLEIVQTHHGSIELTTKGRDFLAGRALI